MDAVFLIAAFAAAFFATFCSYRQGIKDGQKLSRGETVPVKAFERRKKAEEPETQRKMREGIANMLNYANRHNKQ